MSKEDLLNNCDPPVIPDSPGGGGGPPGGPGGPGGGGGGGGGGSGGGGGGRGRRRPPPERPEPPKKPSRPRRRKGDGDGGAGGGGGGAGAGGAGGVPNICQPFSGPPKPTNKGSGWSETPTQYAKIKGEKIKPRKGCIDCEGSGGEGPNDEERFKDLTIYPFNKVTETESGHVMEFDDTPGSERISTNHRSGTFEEYHPNGDKVIKVVRDNYVSILRDQHVHVDGYCDVTIDKALKILVNTDEHESSEENAVNFDIHIVKGANVNIYIEKGNLNVKIDEGDTNVQMLKGDFNIRQDCGNVNHFINGDYNLECTGHMHVVVGKDVVNEIGGNRDVRIDGNVDHLNMTNRDSVQETTLEGDRRTNIKRVLQEHVGDVCERDYGNSVIERFKNGAERTYEKSYTVETHEALVINVGPNLESNQNEEKITFTQGDLSIYANRSVIRADGDNFIISRLGKAGLQGYEGVNIDAGIIDNVTNNSAILKIYSQNASFFGAKNNYLFAKENMQLSSLKNITLFCNNKIFKNKEFEDGGKYTANESYYTTNIKQPPDPTKPVAFIECPSLKWVPTNQKKSCN